MSAGAWFLAGLCVGLALQSVVLVLLARRVRWLEWRCRDLTIGQGRLLELLTTSGRPPEQVPERPPGERWEGGG